MTTFKQLCQSTNNQLQLKVSHDVYRSIIDDWIHYFLGRGKATLPGMGEVEGVSRKMRTEIDPRLDDSVHYQVGFRVTLNPRLQPEFPITQNLLPQPQGDELEILRLSVPPKGLQGVTMKLE